LKVVFRFMPLCGQNPPNGLASLPSKSSLKAGDPPVKPAGRPGTPDNMSFQYVVDP